MTFLRSATRLLGVLNVTNFGGLSWYENGRYIFKYPCLDSHYCSPIQIQLNPGKYKLEAFGASSGYYASYISSPRDASNPIECLYQSDILSIGGNYSCPSTSSNAGAGGYASGILNLKTNVILYINIGGKGSFSSSTSENLGGYNGGGSSISGDAVNGAGSGGGATDFRVINNSLFTRILVAGGGGGPDNPIGTFGSTDDGTGGAGGLPGLGYFNNGVYNESSEVTTLNGYSFGYGMSSSLSGAEIPGAGGGFFGGYAPSGTNAGASGGSSFALNEEIPVPRNLITVRASNGTVLEKGYYTLSQTGPYSLRDPVFITGANFGNGYARITIFETFDLFGRCSDSYCRGIVSYIFIAPIYTDVY